MKTLQASIVAVFFISHSFLLSSQDFAGPWKGSHHEIEKQALSQLTGHAEVQIRRRFVLPDGPMNLERKLWVILDFLVEDEGRNYRSSYYERLFRTISDEDVATVYSITKTKSLIEALMTLRQGVSQDHGQNIFIIDDFTGDAIETSMANLASQRRIRFTCDMLIGCLNILLKHDQKAGTDFALRLADSEHEDIATVGRAFLVVAEKFPDGNEPDKPKANKT